MTSQASVSATGDLPRRVVRFGTDFEGPSKTIHQQRKCRRVYSHRVPAQSDRTVSSRWIDRWRGDTFDGQLPEPCHWWTYWTPSRRRNPSHDLGPSYDSNLSMVWCFPSSSSEATRAIKITVWWRRRNHRLLIQLLSHIQTYNDWSKHMGCLSGGQRWIRFESQTLLTSF
jgi:hypothetical protein